MPEIEAKQAKKILLIRMLSTPEVCAIGVPVVRYFQQNNPQQTVHFMTFDQGAELIKLAEPEAIIKTVTQAQWPDNFFLALESFLGLAEQIISEDYSQIVNLDTSFMPCFLARFLADAGEPVSGNYLNMSVEQLVQQVQQQSLQADYVNLPQAYMASTFSDMHKWHGHWWQSHDVPEGGYPEFYLTHCCGLQTNQLQQSIAIAADKRLAKMAKSKKVIGLCLDQSEDGYLYPHASRLKKLLTQQGFEVWTESDSQADVRGLLKKLAASDLMICKPSGVRWYAQATDCPTLLISGAGEPALLMPEFATDTKAPCAQHQPNGIAGHECNCDQPEDLVESIQSIFAHLAEHKND